MPAGSVSNGVWVADGVVAFSTQAGDDPGLDAFVGEEPHATDFESG